MIKIGILGYSGRMGQAIAAEIAAGQGVTLAAGLVRRLKPEHNKVETTITSDAEKVFAASDVVIDFTLPEATIEFARIAVAQKKPLVSGVTGLGVKELDALKQAAAKIPVLHASNTSVSLVAMKQITALAAKLLANFDFDVSIHDEHHRMKKDAPSGTAKALGEAVARGNGGKKTPAYSATRAGAMIGEHEVAFFGQGELIRLHHSVTDRRIFARGAVQAAQWLHDKPAGFYGMEDVLGI